MKYFSIVLLFVALMFHQEMLALDTRPAFKPISIQEARQKASEEGKLIFMDFHANWCTPCHWMDQTTFTDKQVVELLSAHYVALKIDIDDKQGHEIKKQFDVKYLPTLLIFNSEGIMIERIENTITPRNLKEILSKHNAPDNRKIIKHDPNTSPGFQEVKYIQKDTQPTEIALSPQEQKDYDSKPVNQKIYKLQVGVFERYELAEKFILQLQQTFLEPVTVKNDLAGDKIVFKVYLGQFESKEDALQFKQNLINDHGLDSFVL